MLDRLPASIIELVCAESVEANEREPIEWALERRQVITALSNTSRWLRQAVAPFQLDSLVIEDPLEALRLARRLRDNRGTTSVFRITILNDEGLNEDAAELLALLSVCTQLRHLVLASSRIFSSWFLRDVARYLSPTCQRITLCESETSTPCVPALAQSDVLRCSWNAYFLPTVSVVSLEPGSQVIVDRKTSQVDVTLTLDRCQRELEVRSCMAVFGRMTVHSALVRFDVPGCIDDQGDADDTGIVSLLASSMPATLRSLSLVPVKGCGTKFRLGTEYAIERIEALKLAISTLADELPTTLSSSPYLRSIQLDLSDHDGCTALVEDLDKLKATCTELAINLDVCVISQRARSDTHRIVPQNDSFTCEMRKIGRSPRASIVQARRDSQALLRPTTADARVYSL